MYKDWPRRSIRVSWLWNNVPLYCKYSWPGHCVEQCISSHNCCWRESVRSLQYFCKSMPLPQINGDYALWGNFYIMTVLYIIIIIITTTMFIVLSSWHSHCESSPGSFDECRLSAGWPPTLRPKTKPMGLYTSLILAAATAVLWTVSPSTCHHMTALWMH